MQSSSSSVESGHSVSQYLSGLRTGDSKATQKIWERYFKRLIQLADRKLRSSPRGSMDEDDVVQQVFAEFFAQVQQGRFPKLDDRHDLWQILAMMVGRRSKDQIRKQSTLRAGANRVVNESAFQDANGSFKANVLTSIPSRDPSPAEAMEFVEALSGRLRMLSDKTLRKIAMLKLQGYSNREIAKKMRSSLRSVERTLSRIRSMWQTEEKP